MMELPQYKSHKVVRAAKIIGIMKNEQDFGYVLDLGPNGRHTVDWEWLTKRANMKKGDDGSALFGGYLVVYPDGYESFSPAKAFEEGYTAAGATFVQPKITGYRQLNEHEASMMNDVKALGASIEGHIAQVLSHVRTQRTDAQHAEQRGAGSEFERLENAQPERWAAIARTHFQEGLMALTRAIAQPGSF